MNRATSLEKAWLHAIPVIGLVWRHRDLVSQFTLRTIHLRHRGSYLGILWSLLTPLLMLGLYTVAFGLIMKGGFDMVPNETTYDFALGIFIGMTLFNLVSEIFGSSAFIIISNTNLVKKVVFPLEILPVSTVLAALYHFSMSLILCSLGLIFFGPELTSRLLWVPVLLLPLIMLVMGLAWLVSALGVYFRDIAHITGFVSTALFYVSAIFFSPENIPHAGIRTLLELNPILVVIHQTRKAVLWQMPVELDAVAYLYGCGGLMLLLGYWTFRKLKAGFADVL